MKAIRFTMLSVMATVMTLVNAAFAAPATLTQSVTYNSETITLQLTKENLRGANFELWSQNASGGYDAITPVEERSYIGTVDEYPDAISCGILKDDGSFWGVVYFDRGGSWHILGNTVSWTRGLGAPTFALPTWNITAGHAGSTMYGYDVGIDADYDYFNTAGGSAATALEGIEYSACVTRAIYMRDVLLRPYLGRVILRATLAHDPYTGLTQGSYLDAVRLEWNNNQTDANRDVVAGVSPSKIGGGLAWVGVIGTSSAYSVSQSGGDGSFDIVWRHEMGHNWNVSHYAGGNPEGAVIMGGNQYGRFSGPEAENILWHRDSKTGIMENLGTYATVDLPPYAGLDSFGFVQTVDTTVTVDVLANDHDANGHSLSLLSFDSTSANGGTITQQGQNLVYTAGGSFLGVDSFTYKIQDSSGQTATGAVIVNVNLPVNDPQVAIANHSFESGPGTGVPTDWTLTAGSSTSLGIGAGGTDGSQMIWIGPGVEITQDLGYALTEGEALTLKYASQRSHVRNVQLLAKNGGTYQLLAETTEETGWTGWAYDIQLDHSVAAQYAGQELAIRIISGGWNEFDNFRITSIKGASRPSPFDSAFDVAPTDLSWEPYAAATGYQVYLGTNQTAVQSATAASPEYQGQVTNAVFANPAVDALTTYFWRVDTVTTSGTIAGQVWSFTSNEQSGVPIVNGSFEDDPAAGGVPTGWTVTAGNAADLGTGAGGSNGSQFLYIGTGVEITQDLGYTLSNGEKLSLTYASQRNYGRNVQLLAKNGGTYQLLAETTEATGWNGWATGIQLDYTVAAQYAGQELAIRINSGNWNEFDDFRLISVGGSSGPTNNAPAWNTNPVTEATATEGDAYSSSLADNASDPDSDPLTFSKVSGPAWLSVSSNGAISGTPSSGDVGANQWTVRVTDDGGLSADATLQITVDGVTPPADPPSNPGPISGTTGTSLTPTLTWDAASGADSYDIYFGTTAPGTFQVNQTNLDFDPGTLLPSTTYYWRVDTVNGGGTTTGTVWSFTTGAGGSSNLFSDDFESGSLGNWTTSSSRSVSAHSSGANGGVYGARLKKSSSMTATIDTSAVTSVTLEYDRKTSGMDNGESLTIEWSANGSNWTTVEATSSTSWGTTNVVLPAGAAGQAALQIRFITNANRNKEYGYVDNVVVSGS